MLSHKIVLLGTLLLLTGCGQKQLSSQQEPGHQTATSRSGQTTSSQAASHSSSAASQAPTATFKQQRFTIKDVTFNLTGSKVTASSTANRNLFVLYYSVTNHQAKSIIPNDIWQSAVSAQQSGHQLQTGNLAFTTNQTQDNNKLNRTVMDVAPGKTVTGLAIFEPKNSQPITVTFKDTHHQIIHQSHYPLT